MRWRIEFIPLLKQKIGIEIITSVIEIWGVMPQSNGVTAKPCGFENLAYFMGLLLKSVDMLIFIPQDYFFLSSVLNNNVLYLSNALVRSSLCSPSKDGSYHRQYTTSILPNTFCFAGQLSRRGVIQKQIH